MSAPTPKPAIEFYVIGGYLGAGKTTLLNHLLRQPGLDNTAVLVNDFGKINIDAELIENADGETYRLENGCICCNIGQAFFTTLLQVVKSEPRPRRIIVEASGVADPLRIADIARLSPSMELRRTVVVADCASVREHADNPQVDRMVLRQLESADTLLLNKRDLVGTAAYESLVRWIGGINAGAKIVACEKARVALDVIFGGVAGVGTAGSPADLVPTDFSDMVDRHALVNWTVDLPAVVDEKTLLAALEALPESVHRVKGFARVEKANGWRIVQYAPGHAEVSPANHQPAEELCGRLVFIGTRQSPTAAEFNARLGEY